MGSLPPREDVPRRLADLLARIVALREALADGDVVYAAAIAERVELDLAGWMAQLDRRETA